MKKELKESISNLLGEEVTSEQILGLDSLLGYIKTLEDRIENLEGGKDENPYKKMDYKGSKLSALK